ncbi:hypothetical protein ES319_D04G028400v1 [Gossypium barbadense]|uniref:Uncharacterized protein n=2 Tax=Gossypium TaxID=3633 RepID=A0A5J5RUU0_GOSBA|nr:hypothetical protein ES319_D04G028400v1 [Gossypium barbadense]TYG72548.1 hypothetical protein ES288_D04G029600v1 [Gossypium darwinii]
MVTNVLLLLKLLAWHTQILASFELLCKVVDIRVEIVALNLLANHELSLGGECLLFITFFGIFSFH